MKSASNKLTAYQFQREDRLFAVVRILATAVAIVCYVFGDILFDGWMAIPYAGKLLFLYSLWSGFVVWRIHMDSQERSYRSRFWKRLFVGITLPVDLFFSGYAAFHTGRLSSPFVIAIVAILVFHAYYFPTYWPRPAPVALRWILSGPAAGVVGFLTASFILGRGSSPRSFVLLASGFFALVLVATVGILRSRDKEANAGLQRAMELANLFRDIIKRINELHLSDQTLFDSPGVFNELARTIAENLSAESCEVLLLEKAGRFISRGRWVGQREGAEDFAGFLDQHREIVCPLDGDSAKTRSERAGRYAKRVPDLSARANALAAAMSGFLENELIVHSVFTPILRKSQSGAIEPIGIIRVCNRVHRDGKIHARGFSEEDEEVLQDVAREISAALENYHLQSRLKKTIEKERQLRAIGRRDDLDEVFKKLLASMARMVNAGFAELWTPFEEGFERIEKMVLRAHYPLHGHPAEKLAESERLIVVGKSHVGKLIRQDFKEERIVFEENIKKVRGSGWPRFVHQLGTSKAIAILLTRKQEVLGVVSLHPEQEFTWSKRIGDELLEFAGLATASIESARYRRRYQQLTKLQHGLKPLLVKEDHRFYQNLVDLVRAVMPAEACSIFTVDAEKKALCLRGSSDRSPETQRRIGQTIYYSGDSSFTGRVAGGGQTAILYGDLNQAGTEKIFVERTPSPPAALIACPIHDTQDKLVAVIRCLNKVHDRDVVTNTFSRADTELLEFAVAVIAILMENRLNITRLEAVNRQRQGFMNSVAHEFTSPLQSIRTTAEFLKRYHDRPRQLKDPGAQFDFLIEEVDFLNYLIGNIRSVFEYKFDDDFEDFRPGEIVRTSLFKIVERIQALLKGHAKEKGLRIRLRGDFPTIVVDKHHLEQVIFNLLVNAIKYTRPAINNSIDIICREHAHQVLLIFRNWGIGVYRDESARIFEMYQRGKEAHKLSVEGTGLGLYISRKIMRTLGGDLQLSNLKNPTEFVVYLPKQ